jgi:DNA-binding transcriptional LysR family regulator
MDKLFAMKAFICVVDAGTFTRAADMLNLPKSTVSRMVQALEKEIGAKLLQRTTRQLSVTEEGAVYYEGAVKLFDQLGQLDQSVAGAGAEPRGRIKVEAAGAIVYNLLLPALPQFFERYHQTWIADQRRTCRAIARFATNDHLCEHCLLGAARHASGSSGSHRGPYLNPDRCATDWTCL